MIQHLYSEQVYQINDNLHSYKNLYTMAITTLLVKTKPQKQLGCTSTDDGLNKAWFIHTHQQKETMQYVLGCKHGQVHNDSIPQPTGTSLCHRLKLQYIFKSSKHTEDNPHWTQDKQGQVSIRLKCIAYTLIICCTDIGKIREDALQAGVDGIQNYI